MSDARRARDATQKYRNERELLRIAAEEGKLRQDTVTQEHKIVIVTVGPDIIVPGTVAYTFYTSAKNGQQSCALLAGHCLVRFTHQ